MHSYYTSNVQPNQVVLWSNVLETQVLSPETQVLSPETQVLSDKHGNKENPWRVKKLSSLKLSNVYWRKGLKNRAIRVFYCGSELGFVVKQDGKLKLHSANFCRDRLCPMCMWRRSLKCFYELSKVLNVAQDEHPDLIPIFLTFTLKNCETDKLKDSIDVISKAWNRMLCNKRVKRILKGTYRTLEVTYNKTENTCHPHIHVVALVDKSYFSTGDYIKTREWVKLWRKAAALSYNPMCYVRRVKSEDVSDTMSAVKETVSRPLIGGVASELVKYVVKDIEYLSDDENEADRLVSIFLEGLAGRRLYSYSGILKDIAKRLGAEKPDEGDLVNVNADAIRSDITQMILIYRWNIGLNNYILDEVVNECE